MKKRKIRKGRVLVALFILLFLLASLSYGVYHFALSGVTNDKTDISLEIPANATFSSIATTLKKNSLIRSTFAYKIYVKIHKPTGLKEGTYYVNKAMSVSTLIKTLSGNSITTDLTLTLKEGKNMRAVAALIAKNTNYTEEDFYNVLNNQTYLDQLISKYWFLTDEIKNKEIYYSLEGYLFPDTYRIRKDASIEEILETMLDEFGKKIEPYRTEIEKSNYTLHEMLTLASIIEMEAANSDDRAGVAGVFYNRLKSKWALGSDVTTYYAIKVDVHERDLYQSELDDYNAYNTRNAKMTGKLPVSPICNPGLESIKAAIEPKEHDYYYFVADKNKKTYFSKTSAQHTSTVQRLKDEGLWFTY